jgi:glutaredoxin 3
MKKITIYTTKYCPYCVRAKQFLQNKNIPFAEVQVNQDDENAWAEMEKKSGMKTVPQIWVGDSCIGGYTDMIALDQKGGFLPMVMAAS